MVKGDFLIRTIVSFETAEILESNEIKNCSCAKIFIFLDKNNMLSTKKSVFLIVYM